MGFTLVNLDSGYDRTLLAMAHDTGHSITLDDIRAAQRAFWQEYDAKPNCSHNSGKCQPQLERMPSRGTVRRRAFSVSNTSGKTV